MNSQFLAQSSNLTNISLLIFWQHTLAPTLPFLADIYQLSIERIKQSLVNIGSAAILQLVNKLNQQPLTTILPTNNDRTWFAKSQNFHYLPQQLTQFTNISQQLFDDKKRYYLILGDLLHKIQLPIEKLTPLFDSIVGLSMLLLKDFSQFFSKDNEQDFIKWLKIQPMLINNQQNLSLKLAVGYEFMSIEQNLENDWQTRVDKQCQAYQTSTYLTLFSQDYLQKSINDKPINLQINHKNNQKPLPKFLQPLQKYWIVTATTLSMVVIGGVGLVVNTMTPEKKTTVNQPPVQKYNDVAIMRVASTTDTIVPTTTITPKVIVNDKAKEVEKSQLKSVSSVKQTKVKTTENKKLPEKTNKANKNGEKLNEQKLANKKSTNQVHQQNAKKDNNQVSKKELKIDHKKGDN